MVFSSENFEFPNEIDVTCEDGFDLVMSNNSANSSQLTQTTLECTYHGNWTAHLNLYQCERTPQSSAITCTTILL